MKAPFTLAGMTFRLKDIRFGIYADYAADLYCGKELIARVYNDGQGGATNAHLNPDNLAHAKEIADAVRKEVWLVCENGRELHHDLGTVADEALMRMI